MHHRFILAGTVVLCLLCSLGLEAQQSDSSASNNTNLPASSQPAAGTVPRLIKFTGEISPAPRGIAQIRESAGGKNPLPTVIGVTFSLYELQEGGSPLWSESQKVQVDERGHYTVLLGATQPEGLPLDLFTSGKALWVGVQAQLPGQAEQPRVLLVAVPYSLKSSDADTLGGLPASAYMLWANQNNAEGSSVTPLIAMPAALPHPDARGDPPAFFIMGDGTANYVAKFTSTYGIANSAIYSSAGGLVGIGNTNPAGTLDVSGGAFIRGTLQLPATGTATKTSGFNSNTLDLLASSFNSATKAAVPQLFRWQAEPVGNNTTSPSGTLNLLYLSGAGTPAETGLKIAGSGQITFASGQTFPGAGSGTVTSVGSGAGLTGGPITTSGTLSIASAGVTNAMLANNSITVNPGTGLSGGGTVQLGGTITLNNIAPSLGGTVTSVGSGTGLTGGPITTSGSLSLDTTFTDALYAQLGSSGTPVNNSFFGKETFSGSVSAAGATLPATGTATATAGFASNPLDLMASSYNSSTPAAVPQLFRWEAEPAGNNTASPSGTLNLLYLAGTGTPAETGLSIASNGQITFASGQTFPGTGTGTVTSVGSGAGLTGGPITTSGTLSIATGGVTNNMLLNPSLTVTAGTGLSGGGPVALGGSTTLNLASVSCGAGWAAVALPLTCLPFPTLGANTFAGTQTISSGDLSVSNGNLDLPATTSATAGVIKLGGFPFMHGCCIGSGPTGYTNTFVGWGAGNFTTTGILNTGSGTEALSTNTTGNANTASGYEALSTNTTGTGNTASGTQALYPNTTGSNNTAVGSWAGNFFAGEAFLPTAGSNSLFVGAYATATVDNLTNAAAIGYSAQVGESNALVLGGTGANAVSVGIGTPTPAEALEVVGNVKITGSGHGLTFPDGTTQTTAGGSGSGVTSFNGRTGAVVPQTGDYSFSQVSGTVGGSQLSGTYTNALTFSGALTLTNAGNSFTGSGAGLTGLNASNLASGTVPSSVISGGYSKALTFSNASNSFTGSGAGLTGVIASGLAAGTYSNAYTFSNATNSFTGSGAGLTGVIASGLAAGTYGNAYTFNNAANSFTGNGSGLTGVSASGLVAGTYGNAYTFNNAANSFTATSVTASSLSASPSVYGYGSTGVEGAASNTANAFGVWGVAGTGSSSYAGVFNGNVSVLGTLSKTAGAFKIDHPLDPANKYLLHSFVESPDMKNVYDGITVLDGNGEAWIDLPEWFETLNSDFRYQLTAIGAPAPGLYIAEEISGNRFKIAGGKPGGKVSWQVTGIRQDAYAKAHRIQVEEEKPQAEKGFYLHPELFGQPKEKGIEWAHHPQQMRQLESARKLPEPAGSGVR